MWRMGSTRSSHLPRAASMLSSKMHGSTRSSRRRRPSEAIAVTRTTPPMVDWTYTPRGDRERFGARGSSGTPVLLGRDVLRLAPRVGEGRRLGWFTSRVDLVGELLELLH